MGGTLTSTPGLGVGGFHDGAVVDGSVIAGFFGAESVLTRSPSIVVISKVTSVTEPSSVDIVTAAGRLPWLHPAGSAGRSEVMLSAVALPNGAAVPLQVTRWMRANPLAVG